MIIPNIYALVPSFLKFPNSASHFCTASLIFSLWTNLFPCKASSSCPKIRQSKMWTAHRWGKTSNPTLEAYHGPADKNDSFYQESTAFDSDSWFKFVFQHLRVVLTIDSSLVFKEIAVDWTPLVLKDGEHHLTSFPVHLRVHQLLLNRSTHL